MDDPPGTRIGDAERQEFIDALRQATAEGRLTLDEFSERSGEVYAARTRAELDRQVADLPASSRPASRSPGTAARPPTLRPSDAGSGGAGVAPPGRGGGSARRRFVAIMGASRPRGRWRAAEEISAFAFWGGVVLDLREALIETSVVEITAWAVMGSVDVVVPDGIPVELDGFVLMGGSHDATRGPVIEGAPLVRVKARGMWGGVTVRTGKSAQQKADERALRSDERADRLQRRAEEVADRAQRRAEEALERVRDRHGVPPLHHLHGLPAPRLDDLLPPIFGRRADQVPSERSVSEPAQRWSPADDTPASGSSATGTPTGATGTGTGAGAAAPAAGPAAGGPGATAGPAASDAHDPQADTPAMGTPMTTAPAAGSGRRPDAARTAEAPVADGTPTAGPAPGAGATPGAGSSGPGGDSSPASRRPGPGEESIASSGGSGPGGDSTPSSGPPGPAGESIASSGGSGPGAGATSASGGSGPAGESIASSGGSGPGAGATSASGGPGPGGDSTAASGGSGSGAGASQAGGTIDAAHAAAGEAEARASTRMDRAAPGGTGAGGETGPGGETSTDSMAARRTERSENGGAGAALRYGPQGSVLTMLVTDICGSTVMAEALGDQRWLGVLQAHDALVRSQVVRHHGTEVKALGDGFLVTFTSAREAVLAAMGIQRALSRHRQAYPDSDLHVRIGLHTGEVTIDEGDVVGQNVVVAVRVADAAAPDEILVSSLTHDITDASGDLNYEDGRDADLKGMSRTWRVHTVTWE